MGILTATITVKAGKGVMSLSNRELEELARARESDRVEFKPSARQKNEISDAICAFSNDLPDHGKAGVIFVGLSDDGTCAGLAIWVKR